MKNYVQARKYAIEKDIAEALASVADDPLAYVMWVFPWGKEGTVLENATGPRTWQKQLLEQLGEQIRDRAFDGISPVEPIRIARTSGHGIGKSALSSWIIKFILDTRPYSKGVVTANTSDQLKTKTWAELAKWHNLSITKQFFEYKNARGNMCIYQIDEPEIWRCDALTCREENSEAFAGLHAATSTPFYIFDEASAIPESIHDVALGGLTDGEPMWFQFGNPTRNTGFFREIFGSKAHRWLTGHIDSRDVEGTNIEYFQELVEDYGEDSDFVRVRVKGQFPRASVCQYIPSDLVEDAQNRHLRADQYNFAPIILGVDVAWYGDDRSTIWLRQGLMAKRLWEGRNVDTVDFAGLIAQKQVETHADAIFVDAGGPGAGGVIDQLRRLHQQPIPVYFGGGTIKPGYKNKRAEMWGDMKDWLESGGSLPPKDQAIKNDLIGPEYHITLKGEVQLEKKDDMKKRGLASPDDGDALACTFAAPVRKLSELDRIKGDPFMAQTEYDIFGEGS